MKKKLGNAEEKKNDKKKITKIIKKRIKNKTSTLS